MVGDILRGEREKQGLTIEDIARETSIRDTYLQAIEKGDYDALPGDVYAKGFIRNYSRFLQIDGDALLEKYDEERNINKVVQPVDQPQELEPKSSGRNLFGRNKAKEASPVQESRKQASNSAPAQPKTNLFAAGDAYRNSLAQEEKSGSKKFMILLGIMFVFLGGVYIAFMDDDTENAPKQETVKVETTKPAPAEKKYDGVEIKAKALENCWISVKIDGQTSFEGTVEKGKEMSWQGKESVDIVAGNAGGIQITFNGKDVGTLGQLGQVAERSFKKDEDVKAAESVAQQDNVQSSSGESSVQHSSYAAPEPEPQSQVPAVQETAPAEPAPAAEPTPTAPPPEAQPAAEAVQATPQG